MKKRLYYMITIGLFVSVVLFLVVTINEKGISKSIENSQSAINNSESIEMTSPTIENTSSAPKNIVSESYTRENTNNYVKEQSIKTYVFDGKIDTK